MRRSRSAVPGLIVAYQRDQAEKVEPAVTRAIQKAVGEAEGHHVARAQGCSRRRAGEDGRPGRLSLFAPRGERS